MAAAVDVEDIVDRLRRVDDPRQERGGRHSLVDVLFLALMAMASGADAAGATQDYGEANAEWFAEFLALRWWIRSQDTFPRVFALLSTATVERLFVDGGARSEDGQGGRPCRPGWQDGSPELRHRLAGRGDPRGQHMAGLGGPRSGAR